MRGKSVRDTVLCPVLTTWYGRARSFTNLKQPARAGGPCHVGHAAKRNTRSTTVASIEVKNQGRELVFCPAWRLGSKTRDGS